MSVDSVGGGASSTVGGGGGGASTAAPTARAAAASRAAAARAEEEQRKRRQAEASCTAQLVHSLGVLTQVMDAGLSRGGWEAAGGTGGSGGDREPSLQLLHKLALPLVGSSDAHLLTQASRVAYALATVVCAAVLAPWESAFVCRPTGGSSSASLDLLAHVRTKTVSNFPPAPELGADALVAAAVTLRDLWSRFALLRSALAHVVAVTALSSAASMGIVTVMVQRPPSSGQVAAAAVSSLSSHSSSAVSAASAAPEWIFVTVPEDVVQARFLGVVLERLRRSFTAAEEAEAESGDDAAGLVAAVRARLRASVVRRPDGIVTGTVDVEEIDGGSS
jgi:hypothetical protein